MSKAVLLAKRTFQEWSADNTSRLAAALAYYLVFSIPPLLLIAIYVAGQIWGQQAVENQLVDQIGDTVGENAAGVIETAIANVSQSGQGTLASIAGIVSLLFSASAAFVHLQRSLNTVWNVMLDPNLGLLAKVTKRLVSFLLVLLLGILIVALLVFGSLASTARETALGLLPGALAGPLGQVLNVVVSLVVVTVLVALLFKYLADVKITWDDVKIGAFVTALLFVVGQSLLTLYMGRSSTASVYGAAGSLIVLLLWIYYSAQILFLGAEFTQVYANNYGSKVLPDEDSVPIAVGEEEQHRSPSRAGTEEDEA